MERLKIFLLLAFVAIGLSLKAQQEGMKAKVMIVPEESFCINSGFYMVAPDGRKVPDYYKALQSDNVLDVINTFENLMAGYGFELTNLQQTLNELDNENALDNVLTSKDGAIIMEDDLDKISRVAQADIMVKVAPIITKYGPEIRLNLRVSSIDCASKKALQAFGPISKTSAGSISLLIKSAVTDNIETFAVGLAKHFDDMTQNGREGSIVIKIAESSPLNLESTVAYKGEKGELADLIEYWIAENSVNGKYTSLKISKSSMKFDQVRIPLVGKGAFGRRTALSMESFLKSGLPSLLEQYGISVSTHPVGIGMVYIILGRK